MKLCKNCKTELEDNQKFCYHCGSNELEPLENVIPENDGETSVQSENENVIENPQSDLSKSIDDNYVVTVVDNNVVKKQKSKKKLVKIIIPIVAAIVFIAASLGVFSIINYNNFQPYRDVLEKLENSEFIYYQEYEEISSFEFFETDAELTFFEKLLNLRKVCEVRLTPHIYYLYEEDTVEDFEESYDLISEEEDEEVYNDLPIYCEILIEESGDTKILWNDDILFNVNFDDDKNITSITYNENKKEYINGGIDQELADKYESMVEEYRDYLDREYEAESVSSEAEYAPLYYNGISTTIADFIDESVENPQIVIHANRFDTNQYIITVKGICNYISFKQDAKVVFWYDSVEKESHLYDDSHSAFEWYILDNWQRFYS